MAIWLLCPTPFLNNIQNWVLVVDKGILDAVHVLNVGNVLVLHFTQLVIARCIVKGIRPEKRNYENFKFENFIFMAN